MDFCHLFELLEREVFWVTRAKDDLRYRVAQKMPQHKDPRIVRDELIELKVYVSQKDYPQKMRRLVARVEVDGQEVEMVFLTNHLEWSAGTAPD